MASLGLGQVPPPPELNCYPCEVQAKVTLSEYQLCISILKYWPKLQSKTVCKKSDFGLQCECDLGALFAFFGGNVTYEPFSCKHQSFPFTPKHHATRSDGSVGSGNISS